MQKTHLRFWSVLILSHWLMNVVDGAQPVVLRADFETPATTNVMPPTGCWRSMGRRRITTVRQAVARTMAP